MPRATEQNRAEAGFKRPKDPAARKDYVSSDGKTKYEIKGVTQNEHQTFEASTKNIIRNIKAQHDAGVYTNEKYIIDLVEIAQDVKTQTDIYQHINQELNKQGLETDKLIYLFN